MVVLAVLLGGILFLFVWILFVPVRIVCNSLNDDFRVFQPGTFTVSFHATEQQHFSFYVFGFRIKTDGQKKPTGRTDHRKHRKGALPKRSFVQWQRLWMAFRRALKVEWIKLNIDTDDMLANALLVPAGCWLNSETCRIGSNWEGRLEVDLRMSLYLFKIAGGVFRFVTKI